MSISIVLRLVPEALAEGRLAGEVEMVATGAQGLVATADDIVRFVRAQQAATTGRNTDA